MGNLGMRAEIDFPSWQVSLQMWQPLNFVLGRSMTGLGCTWRTLGGWRKEVFLFGFMDSCVTFITVLDATRVRISARIDSLTKTSAI